MVAVVQLAIRFAALWVLTGAIIKIGWGTPADLPGVIRGLASSERGQDILFMSVVAVETLIGVTALIAPRLGWPAIVSALTVFCGVLVKQIADGETSCGCFGSAVVVPPWLMLGIDGALLAILLSLMPWTRLRAQPSRLWSIPTGIMAAVLGVGLLRLLTGPVALPKPLASDAPQVVTREFGTTDVTTPPTTRPAPTPHSDETATTAPANSWRLPRVFPRYVTLAPGDWINQSIHQTTLATWADTSTFPDEASLIFYYETCDHCATYLREVAARREHRDYVLVQLPTRPDSTSPAVVDITPDGLHVQLPPGTRYVIETPWEVVLKDGVVVDAIQGAP